jgi:TRAP-type C4-dicarboxylate transport system substrate-binding protein
MDNTRTRRLALIIGACLLVAGCSPAGAQPAGSYTTSPAASGTGPVAIGDPPATLRLFVADDDSAPSAAHVRTLVQRVATASGGKITIVPTFNAGGPSFEEGILNRLASGDAELALVGSRSLDLVGETSFTPLTAPFVIDRESVAREIARGEIGRQALAGLQRYVGLALWPEDLRHVTQLKNCGHDLKTPAGMKGTTFLVQPSGILHDALDALGAVRYPTLEADRNIDAEACELQGLEGGLDHLYAIPMRSHPVLLADITIYAKFEVLVANRDTFSRLSSAQQDALRRATAEVQAAAIDGQPIDSDLAGEFCAEGGSVIQAGTGAQAAYREAVTSVTARIERDPALKAQLDAIRALEASSTLVSPKLMPCDSTLIEEPLPSQDLTGYVGTTFPNGTFRRKLVPEELIAAGVPAAMARGNEQVLTYVFDSGRFTFSWDALDNDKGSCTGTYVSVGGKYVELTPDPAFDECGIGPRHMWREVPGGISLVTLDNGSFNADDHQMLDYFPWTRIR